ncbi:GNAT family N-acetyltransferase [Amycolatopsis thailandensis]|uniref:GNAT family N-acetyltransferase n=1 Tax=Amycolatopsis thailandensis TaxID=589330 RepID=A0A229SHN4_9PSEU|nr:GNAT family N-acetyltransferase [Amycolatopsis thailandensis]OXM58274.1 GNAT family N-acetyltransferase [Amycolatopsis thailandensis]
MEIREFREEDWAQVWPIVREVVRAADTYTYDPDLTEETARGLWAEKPPSRTVVAVEDGRVLGTAKTGPNRGGPGSHVSTASFMVDKKVRGKGVGSALCAHVLDWARAQGFAGMQFNAVVESNVAGIRVYERLGFEIVGTVPGAFEHPTLGRIGLHVMYCDFG